jgi:hypothetical protein
MEAVGTTAVGITADITAAGTMVDTAADIGMADTTAVLGGPFGGLITLHRYTVPMPTGIRIMIIHMRIHQRPSTNTSLRQHLQPSATLRRLIKMVG